jgi:hypothetical protein
MKNKDQILKCFIKDSKLIISIGVGTLAFAHEESQNNEHYNEETEEYEKIVSITDPKKFAEDIRYSMLNEREDGACPLTLFLDEMCQAAIDDGSLGVKFLKNDD